MFDMKRSVSILLSIVSVMSVWAQEGKAEVAAEPSRSWYGEELFLGNLLQGSANPTSISHTPYGQLTDFKVSAMGEQGGFRALEQPENSRRYDARVFGIKHTEKVSFEGSFDYHNHAYNDQLWNGTTLISERNPFIIGDSLRYDSLTSDAGLESFRLNGGVAYQLSDKLILALRAEYESASKADQADPRIITSGSRTTVNPGMEYSLSDKLSLGLALNAELYHETVKSTVRDNMITEHNTIFIMRELGKFETKDAIGYHRYYSGTDYGATLQTIYKGANLSNLLELSYSMKREDAVDGGTSYKYLGGDFKETVFGLRDRAMFTTGSLLHNITLSAAMQKGSGTWHTQKQRYDANQNVIWDVLASEVVHKRTDLTAGLDYRLDVLHGGYSRLTLDLYGKYKSTDIKEYPDEYLLKYAVASMGGSVAARHKSGAWSYMLGVNAGYSMDITPLEYDITATKTQEKRVLNRYYIPKYNYEAAGALAWGVKGEVKRGLMLNSTPVIVGLDGGYMRASYNGDYARYMDACRNSWSVALSLTF